MSPLNSAGKDLSTSAPIDIYNSGTIIVLMKNKPEIKHELKAYLEIPGNTQTSLAESVGITQGAIFQMIRSGRSIFVIEGEKGLRLEEVKQISGVA